jgi:hypothetical protein
LLRPSQTRAKPSHYATIEIVPPGVDDNSDIDPPSLPPAPVKGKVSIAFIPQGPAQKGSPPSIDCADALPDVTPKSSHNTCIQSDIPEAEPIRTITPVVPPPAPAEHSPDTLCLESSPVQDDLADIIISLDEQLMKLHETFREKIRILRAGFSFFFVIPFLTSFYRFDL